MSNIIKTSAMRIGRGGGSSSLKPLYANPMKHTKVERLNQRPELAKPSESDLISNRMIPKAWQSSFGFPEVVFTQTSRFEVPICKISFPVQVHAVSLFPRLRSIRIRPIELSMTMSRSRLVFTSSSSGPRSTHETAGSPFPSTSTSSMPHGSVGRNSMCARRDESTRILADGS